MHSLINGTHYFCTPFIRGPLLHDPIPFQNLSLYSPEYMHVGPFLSGGSINRTFFSRQFWREERLFGDREQNKDVSKFMFFIPFSAKPCKSLNFNIISVFQGGKVTGGQICPLFYPPGGWMDISARQAQGVVDFLGKRCGFFFLKLWYSLIFV